MLLDLELLCFCFVEISKDKESYTLPIILQAKNVSHFNAVKITNIYRLKIKK